MKIKRISYGYKGFTHVEASAELGIPLGTVKTRVAMGIMQLRKLFNYYRPYHINDESDQNQSYQIPVKQVTFINAR